MQQSKFLCSGSSRHPPWGGAGRGLVHFYVNLILKHFLATWEQQQQKNIKPLEKTLESPLDSREIKPVNPKGNQS